MRIDRLTPALVRRAIELYNRIAWPIAGPSRPKLDVDELVGCDTLDELFERFDRPKASQRGPTAARYTLRLGNWRYPFMKFVVQEYLVAEEYFFSVDTHDDLRITPGMPDYEGWCELRRFNAQLKDEIEALWCESMLPTHEDLCTLMEHIAELEQEDAKEALLLVVDDERNVARGVAAVLRARGYQVETAFDGPQALERMRHDPRPDLLLLDYALPELDGEEVIKRLRGDPRCTDLPILLATATEIDLGSLGVGSGMLRKPYPREVLFKLIEELLVAARGRVRGARTEE